MVIVKQKITAVLKAEACLVLIMILLLLAQGCSETENAEQPAQSPTPAVQSAAQQTITLTPSEDAAAIGITAENYPRIDG